jgi:hypothetical protein
VPLGGGEAGDLREQVLIGECGDYDAVRGHAACIACDFSIDVVARGRTIVMRSFCDLGLSCGRRRREPAASLMACLPRSAHRGAASENLSSTFNVNRRKF